MHVWLLCIISSTLSFIADLPIDGKYYVTEISAPNGYVNTQEKQEFTFTYGGSDKEILSYSFTFVNGPTTVELSKTDITDGKELPGAHLRVIDENANVIDEWTSTETPHIIQKLVVGREYEIVSTEQSAFSGSVSSLRTIPSSGRSLSSACFFNAAAMNSLSSSIFNCDLLPGHN